jgi:hypothetical protein
MFTAMKTSSVNGKLLGWGSRIEGPAVEGLCETSLPYVFPGGFCQQTGNGSSTTTIRKLFNELIIPPKLSVRVLFLIVHIHPSLFFDCQYDH